MTLPIFKLDMQDVELLLSEKYESGQVPGPPPRIADAYNKTGGNPEKAWENVRSMTTERKAIVHAILDKISEQYEIGPLQLALRNRRYVAEMNGTEYPLIEIVTKNHKLARVLFNGEEVRL